MLFEDHLRSKKIDATAFRAGSPEIFSEWQKAFEEMHPASFNARYLFGINKIRRAYPLRQETTPTASAPAAKPRPVIKPKIS